MDIPTLARGLAERIGPDNILTDPLDRANYAYDASIYRAQPDLVVLPETPEQVAAAVRYAREQGVPIVGRGAGSSLAGGPIPVHGGIVVAMTRFNRIRAIDAANHRAVVEPGVSNLQLSDAVAPRGFFYAPDPGSKKVSTIGGNAATNAGGMHGVKYGITSHHVLGLEVVLTDGETVRVGGAVEDAPGYDLTGLFVGSEGTLGLITEVTVRLVRTPESVKTLLGVFDDLEPAGNAVSDIIAAGIIPACLEMMDRPVVAAVEAYAHANYPLDAEAVLLINVDGIEDQMERVLAEVERLCFQNGAREVRTARTAAESQALWAGRYAVGGAVGRVRCGCTDRWADEAVPRHKLPEMIRRVKAIGEAHNLVLAGVVAHAGDGNIHPLILVDERDANESASMDEAARQILAAAVELGGVITGEHGVGCDREKQEAMRLQFSPADLEFMRRIKQVCDPGEQMNPGKLFPPDYALAESAR